MPAMRRKLLKSRAMNCGPLSEMSRGRASGTSSRARCTTISTSVSSMCPVRVRGQRLHEPGAFARGGAIPAVQAPRGPQHPIGARRAHRHHVGIQHHEREPPITLQGIAIVEVHDGLPLPLLQPVIPRHDLPALLRGPVALAPRIELPTPHPQQRHQMRGWLLALLRPARDEVHHFVPRVMGNPPAAQGSPSSF